MSQEHKALPLEIVGLFAASKGLYYATLAEIAAGRPLPEGAESASHIAFSVAMESLKQRVPCPDWASDQVVSDWARFENFEFRSVDEAFGIPHHKYRSRPRSERLMAYAYSRVRKLQAQDVRLNDGKDKAHERGALSRVGDELHMSGKKVEGLMTKWRKLCRELECDPDETPNYADAQAVIAAAVAGALKPGD